MNFWETVFRQSPVNDGYYDEERLPQTHWNWPEKTWFRDRLEYAREHQPILSLQTVRKVRERHELRAL